MEKFPRKPYDTDAVALLERLRQGELSAEDLVRNQLVRLEQAQRVTNGATHIFHDQALADARRLDATGDRSLPLFGLPCSIKETFGIAGEELTAGSIRMEPERPQENAKIVQRLKDAGAVVIARSNVPEFAMTAESTNLRYGNTNNPLDITRVAGGSSGGESALVGAGASVFGVGSDILGSIRIPAAFCGVVGFKPHSGGVDKTGTWPTVNGHTKTWLALGPLTRSVRDAELVYNVIADKPTDASSSPGGRLVIPEGCPLDIRSPCIEEALEAARAALLQASYRSEVQDFSDIGYLYRQIPKLILDDFHGDWIKNLSTPRYGRFSTIRELFAQLIGKPTIDSGLLTWLLAAPFLKVRNKTKVNRIANEFAHAKAKYQALLGDDGIMVMPTLGLLAPKHGKMNRVSMKPGVNGLFTAHTLGNYLDLPAIAVPAWKYRDPETGLPPSISILSAPGSEAKLFAAAKLVEAALNG